MFADSPVMAVVPAVDMARAKRFYQQKLGLKINMEDQGGTVFACGGGTQLLVYARPVPTKAEHTAASWVVDNIEATVKELTGKGVVFEQYDLPGLKTNEHGIAIAGPGKAAWFKDTEGNILGIVQKR